MPLVSTSSTSCRSMASERAGLMGAMRRNGNNSTMLMSLGLLLVLLAGCAVQVRSEAHYNALTNLRAQLSTPWLSCRTDASICKDPSKNPYVGATTCCGKRICTDLENDVQNCGSCGRPCPFGKTCCKGKCVDLQTEKHNCGKCGRDCRGSTVCTFGLCGYGAGLGRKGRT